MKTIEVKVYSFNELSESAKAQALESFRDVNVCEDDWHEYQLQHFKEILEQNGFKDAEIYFSGFYSQGDGLCFDAKIDIDFFANTVNRKRVARLIDNNDVEKLAIEKTSFANHYSHEKTRYVEGWNTGRKNIDSVIKELCNEVEWLRLKWCNEFYKTLKNYYEELTSDAAIIETIEANEYQFTEDGKQF